MRAGVAAAASAAVVAMTIVAAPAATADSTSDAQSSLIGDGTFGSGVGSWFGYGGSALDASSGAACTTLGAGAESSLYGAGVGLNGVAIEAGKTYTLSFRASASVAGTQVRALVGQNGDPYGTVFDKGDVALGTDLASDDGYYTYSFTADKTFPAGNDDPSDPQGQLAFQLGGHPAGWTFCLDDVSLRSDTEVLPSTTFDGTVPAGWSLSDGYTVTSAEGDDDLCFAVPAGTGQYTGLTYNGVPLQQGSRYRFSYTATATPASQVRSLVGEGAAPYNTFKDSVDVLGDAPKTVSFEFDAPETLPTDGDAQIGQVALQTGAGAADHGYTLCVTSISLLKLAAGPKPYEPDTRSAVRVNQVGYLPDGPKNATVVSDATTGLAWDLLDASDASVAHGTATPAGVDPSAGVAVQTIDFSSFTTAGEGYRIKVGDDVSDPFTIGADVYQTLPADALDYFYKVRSGIAVDPAIAGDGYGRAAGHVSSADPTKNPEGTKNKGDLDVPCLTADQDGASWSYGTWTCPAGYSRDVVGGWYDAGDHGKYVVNGGIAVSQLLSAYERSKQAPSSDDALGDDTLAIPETGNDVPDVLDEAKWELDFLLSMQVPLGTGMKYDGRLLDGMVHHKVHDVGWTGLPLDPAADPQARALARRRSTWRPSQRRVRGSSRASRTSSRATRRSCSTRRRSPTRRPSGCPTCTRPRPPATTAVARTTTPTSRTSSTGRPRSCT
jgi:endoglucanase